MNQAHNVQRLDLNLIAVLDAMFREGSVTAAGKSLGLSQSAMSHSLSRLREFFDDTLFVKTKRGMSPTEKALGLRETTLEVMARVRDELLTQTRFDPLQVRRTFSFCMSDMGELVFLPSLLTRLKQSAPNCKVDTIQVPVIEIESTLATGQADLALGSASTITEDLFQEELFTHTFVSIVSKKNREIRSKLTLSKFLEMPHVVVALRGRSGAPYDSALEEAGIVRRIAVSTPHFLFVPLLLDQHPEYVATVPRALATVFARHGVVAIHETPVPLPTFSLRQYWHPRVHHDRANIWLRHLVRESFRELPSNMM